MADPRGHRIARTLDSQTAELCAWHHASLSQQWRPDTVGALVERQLLPVRSTRVFSLSRVAGLAAMLLAGFVAGAASHVGGLRAPLAMHQPPRLVAPAPQTIGLVVKDSRPSPSSAAPIAPMSSAVTPGIVRHVSAHAVASASLPKRVRGYAVTVGAFATAHAATREMHVIRSKGYVVNVVRRGGVAQVVTPPYPTLAQAERVLKGLQEVGAGGRITLM